MPPATREPTLLLSSLLLIGCADDATMLAARMAPAADSHVLPAADDDHPDRFAMPSRDHLLAVELGYTRAYPSGDPALDPAQLARARAGEVPLDFTLSLGVVRASGAPQLLRAGGFQGEQPIPCRITDDAPAGDDTVQLTCPFRYADVDVSVFYTIDAEPHMVLFGFTPVGFTSQPHAVLW